LKSALNIKRTYKKTTLRHTKSEQKNRRDYSWQRITATQTIPTGTQMQKTALPTGTARIRTRMLPETAIPVQKCLTAKTAAEIRMRTTSQTVTEKRADGVE
jgi:hypothetical protein